MTTISPFSSYGFPTKSAAQPRFGNSQQAADGPDSGYKVTDTIPGFPAIGAGDTIPIDGNEIQRRLAGADGYSGSRRDAGDDRDAESVTEKLNLEDIAAAGRAESGEDDKAVADAPVEVAAAADTSPSFPVLPSAASIEEYLDNPKTDIPRALKGRLKDLIPLLKEIEEYREADQTRVPKE